MAVDRSMTVRIELRNNCAALLHSIFVIDHKGEKCSVRIKKF
jgi:hypothetical protein